MGQYFIRRNQRILGPLAESQVLELYSADRVLDSDEISTSGEGPWSEAKPFLLELASVSTDKSIASSAFQNHEFPPDIAQEPPSFEIDFFNGSGATDNAVPSITGSFEDWVQQDISDVPPARYSEWVAPLDLKTHSHTSLGQQAPGESKAVTVPSLVRLQKAGMIYVGIGISFAVLFILFVGIMLGRSLNNVQKMQEIGVPLEAFSKMNSIPSSREDHQNSFETNHGRAFVDTDPTGSKHITIECQSGLVIDAIWRPVADHEAGFKIISVETDRPYNDMGALLIVRDVIAQYLRTQQ